MDEEYVAELLKQLEELKRKKAHKERKLQKLKGCSIKDLKRERSRVSHTSVPKESDQIQEFSLKKLNDENIPEENSSEKKFSDSVSNLNHERSHLESFENPKYDKKGLQNNSVVNIKNSITSANEPCIQNQHFDKITSDSLKNFSPSSNSVKYDNCKSSEDVYLKPTISRINSNCDEGNLSVLNNKLNNDVEKSCIIIEKERNESVEHHFLISNDSDIHNVEKIENNKTESIKHNLSIINDKNIHNIKEASSSALKNLESSICDREIKSGVFEKVKESNINDNLNSVSDIVKNYSKHNSPESENKLCNDSNKHLTSSKSKSSDILDDSLNSNMSFFMSADLFANEDNHQKNINKNHNNDDLGLEINEDFPTIKNESKKIDSKLFLDHSHLPINGYQKNDIDVFSFPKFSTPTAGNTQAEKDDDDIIEKSPEIDNSAKRNNSLTRAFKNILPSTSKCDSPLLNFVLEKRLSSVLDAHYESPKKPISKIKISSNDNSNSFDMDPKNSNAFKKRKLFTEPNSVVSSESKVGQKINVPDTDSNKKSVIVCESFRTSVELDQEMKYEDFDNVSAFDSGSNSSNSLKNISEPPVALVKDLHDDIPAQVSKTVDGLVSKICDNNFDCKPLITESININDEKCIEMEEESKMDSEILVIPETEGLGLYFAKDTEEFLETSTLSESMRDFPGKENFLNVSSQSKLESPVVNNIVAAVRSSRSFQNTHQKDKIEVDTKNYDDNSLERTAKNDEKIANDAISAFDNSLGLDTSFLEDDTQDLGNFKQMPYMNDVNVDEKIVIDENKTDRESNLKFICSLSGSTNEPVMNVEIILFHNVKYAVLQHRTYLCVWRQEKKKQWIKIFNHQIEDMLSLEKISICMDDDNLVIIMLLSDKNQYCLQFLIFERDARVIKLMENTHWLEERCSEDSILLCGLSGLMFATAQNKEKAEVSVHAFISLKENPRLMSAVLGSTETPLCSLCKIDKLPNALMGVNDSMLYVWHILEARLVTAVSLHPHDYITIKECFWATVENGLIYFLTTCEEDENHHICQLLAANLATGFCQSAMSYSTLPSNIKVKRIIKAKYQEPFLVVAHTEGAFIWSIMEEFCCAALPSASNISSIAISRDFDNWGLLAVGSKDGFINCYSLH